MSTTYLEPPALGSLGSANGHHHVPRPWSPRPRRREQSIGGV